jgi:hypothetical protein
MSQLRCLRNPANSKHAITLSMGSMALVGEAGATAPRAAPQKRLLIAVEDDANDTATVQRVRGKLQWIGESSPCPF